MNLTGRSRSSVPTMIISEQSSSNTIQIQCFSFTKALDQTSGTETSFAPSETVLDCASHPTGSRLAAYKEPGV